MYLITLKVSKIFKKMFALITEVNEGESQIHLALPSTLEMTYSSVEKKKSTKIKAL
jgi:hypothetical protein